MEQTNLEATQNIFGKCNKTAGSSNHWENTSKEEIRALLLICSMILSPNHTNNPPCYINGIFIQANLQRMINMVNIYGQISPCREG